MSGVSRKVLSASGKNFRSGNVVITTVDGGLTSLEYSTKGSFKIIDHVPPGSNYPFDRSNNSALDMNSNIIFNYRSRSSSTMEGTFLFYDISNINSMSRYQVTDSNIESLSAQERMHGFAVDVNNQKFVMSWGDPGDSVRWEYYSYTNSSVNRVDFDNLSNWKYPRGRLILDTINNVFYTLVQNPRGGQDIVSHIINPSQIEREAFLTLNENDDTKLSIELSPSRKYLYAAGYRDNFQVVNVEDPNNMSLVSSNTNGFFGDGYWNDMVSDFENKKLYATVGYDFVVYDIDEAKGNDILPSFVGELDLGSRFHQSIAYHPDIQVVFVIRSSGFYVIDVSDPENPDLQLFVADGDIPEIENPDQIYPITEISNRYQINSTPGY